MKLALYATSDCIKRALSNKNAVLSVYPELAGAYARIGSGCRSCGQKRTGRAILLHILNDPDILNKDIKVLSTFLSPGIIKIIKGGK